MLKTRRVERHERGQDAIQRQTGQGGLLLSTRETGDHELTLARQPARLIRPSLRDPEMGRDSGHAKVVPQEDETGET